MILLIHPPVAKPCEPPGGLVQLAGALRENGVPFRVWDASLEGLLFLICSARPGKEDDTWTKRAFSKRLLHLESLRRMKAYGNVSRYRRVVSDLSRVLEVEGNKYGVKIGLADYRDPSCLPVSTHDLLKAAQQPERNPFYSYYLNRLDEILRDDEPHIIGISLNFLSQAVNSFALAGLLRRLVPSARLVFGGSLVTTWCAKLSGKNPFGGLVDVLVAGPGEEPLLNMAGKNGGTKDCRLSLEGFPLPDYLSPYPVLPVSLSWGCYYGKCLFCPERAQNRGYQVLKESEIARRVESVLNANDSPLIHFLDAALSPRLLKDIAKLALPASWYGFARITDELADEDFVRELKKSGCVMLKLGVESGSQAVLDSLAKGIHLGIASRALHTLKRVGIATYVYLLFGTPEEGEEEARDTLRFVLDHSNVITYLNLSIFNLPAGTRPDLKCRPFYSGDLSLYEDFEHPRGWDRRKVRAFLDREFRANRSIQEILSRMPPVFTSNHAPFFSFGGGWTWDPDGKERCRHPGR